MDLNPLNKVGKVNQAIISEENNYEDILIKSTSEWMMFCAVWNKIYRTDIIRENNIMFSLSTNLHEDRIFNLYYAGHANRVVILPYIGYNYVVNPKSITHKKIASSTFLSTGLELDNILRKKHLGNKMQKYTAIFSIRFLTRAIITGLFSPTKGRWKEVISAIQYYFHSNAFKRFRIQTFGWSLTYIIHGIKRKI